MRKLSILAVMAATSLFATPAMSAVTYNLSSDFSNINNPNGVWSFTQGATALAHYPIPITPNALNVAAANGYWGTGPGFNTAPFVIRTTSNGSAAVGYDNNAFLTGDVILHSTNPGNGADLFVNWTAPASGIIDVFGSVWYAHTPVDRSNDVVLTLGATNLITTTLTNAITRSNAFGFSNLGLTVAAGQVISFRFKPTVGQQFGSVAGLNETVIFTANAAGAVPEPATWGMMLLGFGLVGSAMRRRDATRVRALA